ncbi:MAG: hypothetical protein ACLQPH_01585 [Acidimicrobiales bacterium]
MIYWSCAGLLIPWIFHLLRRQPSVVLDYHSRLLWLCIAVLMLGGMTSTGALCWQESPYAVVTATFTATVLFMGAWFGVLTSAGFLQKVLIGFAVVVQLPISILSFVVAFRITERQAVPHERARAISVAYVVGANLLIPTSLRRIVMVAPIHIGLHQKLTWSGLDVFEFAALLWTGWCIRERSPWLAMVATATATLLISDALFNIVTSSDNDILGGVAMAVVAELPLAATSLWLAVRETRTWHLAPAMAV